MVTLYKATPTGKVPLSVEEIEYAKKLELEYQKVKKDEVLRALEFEINRYLNSFAATRGYDNVNSAAKYLNVQDTFLNSLGEVDKKLVLNFKTEAQYLLQMNSLVWAKYIAIVTEINAGTRPLPTSFEDIKQELPQLTWPV